MMLKESKETHGKPTNNERVVAHAGAKEVRMKNPAEEYVTLVEVLELTVPYEEFEEAVSGRRWYASKRRACASWCR
jgi:hypothetical protein